MVGFVACSGIGLAIARSLAQQGVNVVVHGSRDRQKDDAVDQLQSEFPHVRFVYCKADLSQLPAAAESLINTCVKELGSIDILSAFAACAVGCISCVPL